MGNNNEGGSLNLLAAVAMIAGGMIGSAIFSLSGLTMFTAGPAAIVTWIIAALIMLCYGLVCAELATRFPESGGVFVFPTKALGKTEKEGRFWGWISVWGYFNANIVAVAFAAIYVGTYLSVGFPIFDGMQVPLAVGSVVLVYLMNIMKMSSLGKLNNVLVAGIVITMLIYIITSVVTGAFDTSSWVPFFSQGAGGTTGFLSAVPIAMTGYGSIVAVSFMVQEVKNPNKNVPRAVLIALAIVCLLYVGMVAATLGMLTVRYLTENPGMRFIPMYAAAFTKLSAIPWMSKVISISALLALITTMLVVMSLTARAMKAVSDTKLLPKAFGKMNGNGIPIFATTVVAVSAGIISCFPDFTEILVSLGALFAVVVTIMTNISLIAARKKFALPEGAFQAPLGATLPWISLILTLVCNISSVLSGNVQVYAFTIVWYVIGIIYYKIRVNKIDN